MCLIMTTMTDILNPTFLMCLGIILISIACLVIYFENKLRDQNHKMSSMLGLVTSLTDEVNHTKKFLLRMTNNMPNNAHDGLTNEIITHQLIEVSDDESSEDESDNDEEIGSDSDNDEYKESDSESDNESTNNIKVLTLNIHKNIGDIDESENLDLEETVSFGDFEPEDELPEDELSEDELQELSEDYTEEKLNLQYHETTEETKFISSSDLKTININLEESQTENCDFKKLSLPKLRSIVIEKRLASNLDANKFKKQELLKLLGAE